MYKISISNNFNYVILNFLFTNKKRKSIMVSTEIWSSTTVFNIGNNQKSFLTTKSTYYNDYWIMWHWRLE